MLKWYSITAPSEEAQRNVLKSLREQHLMVRKQNGRLYACVSNHHQVWLAKVCQDFSANLKILEGVPSGIRAPRKEEYLTSCGEKFYDHMLYSQHCKICIKCKSVSEVKVVAKLSPGEPFNLNGVVNSLENVLAECLEWAGKLDTLITNLKEYRDGKEKLVTLKEEVDKRIEAVRLLLRDGKA